MAAQVNWKMILIRGMATTLTLMFLGWIGFLSLFSFGKADANVKDHETIRAEAKVSEDKIHEKIEELSKEMISKFEDSQKAQAKMDKSIGESNVSQKFILEHLNRISIKLGVSG